MPEDQFNAYKDVLQAELKVTMLEKKQEIEKKQPDLDAFLEQMNAKYKNFDKLVEAIELKRNDDWMAPDELPDLEAASPEDGEDYKDETPGVKEQDIKKYKELKSAQLKLQEEFDQLEKQYDLESAVKNRVQCYKSSFKEDEARKGEESHIEVQIRDILDMIQLKQQQQQD